MAYRATLNGEVFFDTNAVTMALGLSSAILNLKAGAAGEFTFKVPHINRFYNDFHLISDYIDVYRDNELIFSGRVSSINMDFDGSMDIEAEGLLAIFNDTIYRPVTHEGNLHALVRSIINNHNSQVESAKQITVKTISISDVPCYRAYENYESSYSRLEDLVESFGGYISIRKENGVLCFYWEEISLLSTQTIDFGENILSIDKESNTDNLITVLIPLGANVENETTGERKRLTIASVNSGSDYIEVPNTTEKIVGVEIWDDVEIASNLLTKGREFLNNQSKFKTTINVTAVDLADTGLDIEHFKVGKKIKVTSIPHGLENQEFECLSQRLNLLSPSDNTLALGTVRDGFTVKANKNALLNTKLIEKIVSDYVSNVRLNNVKTDVEDQILSNYTAIEQNSEAIRLVGQQVNSITQIYYEQPEPPYLKGDLWYRGISYDKGSAVPQLAIPGYAIPDVGGDLFICVEDKADDEQFDQNDWKPTFSSQFKDLSKGITSLVNNVTNAELEINAAKAQINLNAEAIDYNKQEISSVHIEMDALRSSIELKVDKTNYNAAEIALMINSAGSTVKIAADHIKLEGAISANNTFSIDVNGLATMSGGYIGGFQIDDTSIHTNGVSIGSNAANSVGLSSSTFSRTINSSSLSNLKFAIGGNFAVSNTGILYANTAVLTNASITGGQVTIRTNSETSDAINLFYSGKSLILRPGYILNDYNVNNNTLSDSTYIYSKLDSSPPNLSLFYRKNSLSDDNCGSILISPSLRSISIFYGSASTGQANPTMKSSISLNDNITSCSLSLGDVDSSRYGNIWLYNTNAYGVNIRVATSLSANRTVYFPNAAGTVLLDSGFTMNGNITMGSGTLIYNAGNIAVHNASSNPMLALHRSTDNTAGGRLRIYNASGYYANIHANSSMSDNITISFPQSRGTLALDSTSARRYKKYIKPITDKNLDPHKLLDIPIVQYKYRANANLQYADMKNRLIPGILADDVEKIYQSAAIYDGNGNIESWDERRIVPGMLYLIQEMYRDLQEIKHGSL